MFLVLANQSEAAIFDEPMSRRPKHTINQGPSGCTRKDRKRSKRSRRTKIKQFDASCAATHHSLEQANDSTDNELEPTQPHIADFKPATSPVHCEKNALLTSPQSGHQNPLPTQYSPINQEHHRPCKRRKQWSNEVLIVDGMLWIGKVWA